MRSLRYLFAPLLGLAAGCLLIETGARLGRNFLPATWQALPALHQGAPALNDLYLFDARLKFKLRPNLDSISYRPLGADSGFTIRTVSLGFPDIGFRSHPIAHLPVSVAIGDSFTFCWTALDDCWVQRLARLRDQDFVNLGVPGYGGLQESQILEDYALPLHPQLIIWGFFVNDLWDNVRPNAVVTVDRWTWLERRSVLFGALRMRLNGATASYGSNHLLVTETGARHKTFYDGAVISHWLSDEALEAGWAVQRDAVVRAKHLTDAAGVPLLIVLIPYREQIYFDEYRQFAPELTAERMDRPYQLMRDLCRQHDIDVFDLSATFAAHRAEQFTYPIDAHFNELGNAIMAAAIRRHLVQRHDVHDSAP
jgi:GDSL-like Lipase/Acylhydrolase family